MGPREVLILTLKALLRQWEDLRYDFDTFESQVIFEKNIIRLKKFIEEMENNFEST